MYVREDQEGLQLSHMFKKTFCRTVHTEFLGVWSVYALKLPRHLPHRIRQGHCGIRRTDPSVSAIHS